MHTHTHTVVVAYVCMYTDVFLRYEPYCKLLRAIALSCIFLPSQINIFILCCELIRESSNFYKIMLVATQYKMCINACLILRAYHH